MKMANPHLFSLSVRAVEVPGEARELTGKAQPDCHYASFRLPTTSSYAIDLILLGGGCSGDQYPPDQLNVLQRLNRRVAKSMPSLEL